MTVLRCVILLLDAALLVCHLKTLAMKIARLHQSFVLLPLITVFKSLFFAGLLTISGYTYAQPALAIAEGPFKPTEESLKQYQYPDWFRDAKFGIWAHWGPQSIPRQGDWYARNMYLQGSRQNKYHVEHYGHPSKFGYKDIIALWKAEKWDPEKLMKLYKRVGAKYFVSMASHHDNFFLYKSNRNPYNAVQMGPKRDVVGLWQQAAKNEGLHFGVSEHTGASYRWFQSSHASDTAGPMKGVPYDGADPKFAALYHHKIEGVDPYKAGQWFDISDKLKTDWYYNVKELVDTYHPDLLYSDAPFNWKSVSYSMLANLYNGNQQYNGGKLQAVYNAKDGDSGGMYVEDLERSVKDTGSRVPWQTDTSIGDWFYRDGQKNKTSTEILQMLVDIVSKNGNLLLNIVQSPEGEIDADILTTLEEIAAWTAVNGEGIYGSRPWKIWGQKATDVPAVTFTKFNNEKNVKYSARDIRYTAQGKTVYAYALGTPTEDIQMMALGKGSSYGVNDIASVTLLGSKEKLSWKQGIDALIIAKPVTPPAWQVIGFKIAFKR